MLVVRGTKKLRDRVKGPTIVDDDVSTGVLGDWFATAQFWRPQVALVVNARTYLPLFVPLAPAPKLLDRLPGEIARVLDLHGFDQTAIDAELAHMADVALAPTNDRSVVGVMNEFAFLGEHPETIKIVEWPALDFDDHPTLLPETVRPRVAARFTAGGYVALPPRTGELRPGTPFVGDRFTLRWTRKKTGHVDSGAGAWDVFKDRIEVACNTRKQRWRPLFTGTIENPGDDTAAVHVLSPTHVLVHKVDVWGVEGDIGSREEAALVDLAELRCP